MKEINLNQQINKEDLDLQKRARGAEKLIKFLDSANISEYLNNVLEGKEAKPNFDEFKNFIIRINGITRELPSNLRGFDGEKVELKGYIEDALVPKHKDKEDVLKYLYNSLNKIKKEDLKYAIPSVLNALHLFSDGNGRTSRIMHQLLTTHPDREELNENLKKALSKYGRFDTQNINPDLITNEIEKIVLDKYDWDYADGIRPTPGGIARIATIELDEFDKDNKSFHDANKLCKLFRSDRAYVLTAIKSVIDDKVNDLFGDYKQAGVISLVKMAEQLNEQEWERIFNEYYKLKKEHVKILVDIFAEPDSFQSDENNKMNLKDIFIKRINENYQKNK